jgi:hypothetical protein
MQASDLRDERNEEQLQRLNESESNVPSPPPPPGSSAFDVDALAAHLSTAEKGDEPGDFELDEDDAQEDAPSFDPFRD